MIIQIIKSIKLGDGVNNKITEEFWVDITLVGSQYEEQLEIYSNKHRYRPLKIGMDRTTYEERGIGEWKPGLPPN